MQQQPQRAEYVEVNSPLNTSETERVRFPATTRAQPPIPPTAAQAQAAMPNNTDQFVHTAIGQVKAATENVRDSAGHLLGQAAVSVSHAAELANDTAADVAEQAIDVASDAATVGMEKAAEIAEQAKEKATEVATVATEKASELADKAAEVAVASKDKAVEIASNVADQAAQAATASKDKAVEIAGQAMDKASEVAVASKDKAVELASNVADQAAHLAAASKEKATEIAVASKDKAVEIASNVADQAAHLATASKDKAVEIAGQAMDKATEVAVASKDKAVEIAGQARDRAAEAAIAGKDMAVEIASTVADQATHVAVASKDKAVEIASNVADQAAHVAVASKDKAVEIASNVADQAAHIAVASKDKAVEIAGQARDRAAEAAIAGKDMAVELASNVADQATHLATASKEKVTEAAGIVAEKAKETASSAGELVLSSVNTARLSLEDRFHQAVNQLASIEAIGDRTVEDRSESFALWMQATRGNASDHPLDVSIPHESLDRSRHEAWVKLHNMGRAEAMVKYIAHVTTADALWLRDAVAEYLPAVEDHTPVANTPTPPPVMTDEIIFHNDIAQSQPLLKTAVSSPKNAVAPTSPRKASIRPVLPEPQMEVQESVVVKEPVKEKIIEKVRDEADSTDKEDKDREQPNQLQEQFEKAVWWLKHARRPDTNLDDRAKTFAMIHQATSGDVRSPQPWAIQTEERAKWDAWYKLKGTKRDDAMQMVVNKVTVMDPNWHRTLNLQRAIEREIV